MDCLFCQIGTKALPAVVRYEDSEVLAFDDIHPKAPTHILVIPKRHVASVRDLTSDDRSLIAQLVLVARQLAEDAGIGERGYKLIVNCGREGGQVVSHLHVHLLGGKPLQDI